MRKTYRIFHCMACVSMFILFLGAADAFGADSLLPEGLKLMGEYRNGVGPSVGTAAIVQGRVIVMHKGEEVGYLLRKGTPLFNGDLIVTEPGARAQLSMKDGSDITMTPNSKFNVNRSSYDKEKKTFSSYYKVAFGKLRFRVMKFLDRKHPEYRVTTRTMVCGVRGSDFSVEVDEFGNTVVRTFGDTNLEVWNTEYPDEKVLLTDWQQTEIKEGELPTLPVDIPMEDREPMMREFEIKGEGDLAEGGSKLQVGIEPGGTGGEGGTGILVPQERLLEPDALLPAGSGDVSGTPDLTDLLEFTQDEADMFDEKIEIQEAIVEEAAGVTELPAFPNVPEYSDIID